MGNKIIKKSLTHYYDEYSNQPTQPFTPPPEPDKSKSISELNQQELQDMIRRLGEERQLEAIIKELKRNAGEQESFEKPFQIDTTTPIDQLYHYGTIGMRWGRRRYQNEDGSRTMLGRSQDRKRGRDIPMSEDSQKTKAVKKRGLDGFSNDDLKRINERLQLEDSYKKLTEVKKSESWVKQAIQKAGKDAVTDFTKGIFLGAAKTLVKEIAPEFAETAGFSSPAKPQAKPQKKD